MYLLSNRIMLSSVKPCLDDIYLNYSSLSRAMSLLLLCWDNTKTHNLFQLVFLCTFLFCQKLTTTSCQLLKLQHADTFLEKNLTSYSNWRQFEWNISMNSWQDKKINCLWQNSTCWRFKYHWNNFIFSTFVTFFPP